MYFGKSFCWFPFGGKKKHFSVSNSTSWRSSETQPSHVIVGSPGNCDFQLPPAHSLSKNGVTASGVREGIGDPRNPFRSLTMHSQPASRASTAVTALARANAHVMQFR